MLGLSFGSGLGTKVRVDGDSRLPFNTINFCTFWLLGFWLKGLGFVCFGLLKFFGSYMRLLSFGYAYHCLSFGDFRFIASNCRV